MSQTSQWTYGEIGSAAVSRTVSFFSPFDFKRFICILFIVWLASLSGGGGAGFGSNFNPGGNVPPGQDFDEVLRETVSWIQQNWSFFVTIGTVVLGVIYGFFILFLWLGTRGKFLLSYSLITGETEIALPWREYSKQGNQFFLLFLLIDFSLLTMMLGFIFVLGYQVYQNVNNEILFEDYAGELAMMAVPFSIFYFIIVFVFWIFKYLMADFTIPYIVKNRASLGEGISAISRLIKENTADVIVFMLYKFGLSIVCGLCIIITTMIFCVSTCCLGVYIPVINMIPALPFILFLELLPLFFMNRFGGNYVMIEQSSNNTPQNNYLEGPPDAPVWHS